MSPIPKRSEVRRRNNSPRVRRVSGLKANPPSASSTWHPTARRWYHALARSGQAVFYESSDWMTAYLIAEQISRALKPRYLATVTSEDGRSVPYIAAVPINGGELTAILRAMTALCVTEGDRRRAHIELTHDGVDSDELAASNDLAEFVARRKQADGA